MKTQLAKIYKSSYVLFSLLLILSCSTEDSEIDGNPLGLPKNISELYQDGSAIGDLNGKVSYDGNKIKEIYYNAYQKKVFTYTNNLIAKIEHYQAGELRFKHSYEYFEDKLIRYENVDLLTGNNDLITYTHNNDGTITYVQVYSFSGSPNWMKEGILYFDNQNIIKDEGEFRFNNISDEYHLIINFIDYDNKQNPYKNIAGYSLLLNLKGIIGNSNIISDYTYSTSFKNAVQYAESITGKEYEFKYDQKGRTVEMYRYSNELIGGEILYLDRIFKFKY